MITSLDILIDELLARLGVELAPDREAVLAAMVDARITNGRKSRISLVKEPAIAALLSDRFVPVCDRATCLSLAIRRAPDRRPYRVSATRCAVCSPVGTFASDPLPTVIVATTVAADDDLTGRVAALLAERPHRFAHLVRLLRDDGIDTDKRTLRHLVDLVPSAFLVRPGEVLELRVPAERVPELMAAALAAAASCLLPAADPTDPDPTDPDPTDNEPTDAAFASPGDDETDAPTPGPAASELVDGPAADIDAPAPVAVVAPSDLPVVTGRRASDPDTDLQAAEDRRAGSFLDAMSAIEAELRRRVGGDPTEEGRVSALLETAAALDPLVRSNHRILVALIRLRNAVSHESRGGRWAAVPSVLVVEDAHRLARRLAERGRAVDLLPGRVVSVAPDDTPSAVLTAIRANGGRGVPVHDGSRLHGVITPELLLDWVSIATTEHAGRPLLHGEVRTASDLLALDPDIPAAAVARSASGPGEVAALLAERGGPGFVIITAHGESSEAPMALATACDLPVLLAAAAAA